VTNGRERSEDGGTMTKLKMCKVLIDISDSKLATDSK